MAGKSEKYDYIRPALVIFFLAAPAVGLKLVSTFSNDPYLQPLHITKEGLAAAADGNAADGVASIRVEVAWGRSFDGAMTRDRLRQSLTSALEARTDYFLFKFNDVPGESIEVSFVVGSNLYGPYPPSTMADGMGLAFTALKMSNRPEG